MVPFQYLGNMSASKKDSKIGEDKAVESASPILLSEKKKASELLKGIVHATTSNHQAENVPDDVPELHGKQHCSIWPHQ